jgi:hypothetical protein
MPRVSVAAPIRTVSLALLVLTVTGPPLVAAGDQSPVQPTQHELAQLEPLQQPATRLPRSADFLFGAPRGSVSVRGSWLVPRAGGDLFEFVSEQLTLERSDFRARGFATDVAVAVTPRFDVVAGFDIAREETGSEYRRFVASNSQPIAQATRLQQTTVSGGVRYSLLGRGRSISRYAFIPRRIVPYAGAGATVGFYSFAQRGQFVDFTDLSIFTDRFVSDGWTVGPYVHGGADVQVWKRLSVTFDARYTWLHADLDSDFGGFDGIDLAGFRGGTGISILF